MNRSAVLVAVLALAPACFEDHYECVQDSDCDVGTGGRCEVTHHCTALDPTCTTGRRYAAHAGSDTDACWLGTVALANPCAAGQPPAVAEGCAADVCAALPACCATGWSDACVLEAQRRCQISCDTRIALTANKGATTELWELRFDGTTWSATQHTDRDTLLAYLAPAPGTTEPRLAGLVGPTLAVANGDTQLDIPLYSDHTYLEVHSVDFDRDTRDTIALSANSPAGSFTEIAKLDASQPRLIHTPAALRETWGDYDHDAYPDAVAGAGTRYHFLASTLGDDHLRSLDGSVSAVYAGDDTGGVATRAFDWIDVNGDSSLDLVAYGNALAVHFSSADRVSDRAAVSFDCAPLAINPTTTCTGATTITGAARPNGKGADLVAATIPQRALYLVTPKPAAIATIGDTCPMCGAILAVVVRDIDGDHMLDTVAIDSSLKVFVQLAGTGPFTELHPITTQTTNFAQVRASVSGAPR